MQSKTFPSSLLRVSEPPWFNFPLAFSLFSPPRFAHNAAMIDLAALSSLFKAVGDPLRLRILQFIRHEELSVGELVRILELPQSTVSRHLKALKEQGLVADRPIGSATFYRASLEADLGNGDTALRDAIDRLLAAPLPAPEQARLGRVLALRETEGDDFFDRVGLRWDALREQAFGPLFHLEALARLLPRDLTVAALGSGTGYLLPLLGSHFRRVIAVDMSRQMLDLARRRVEEAGLANVDLRHGTIEQLPIAAAEIDLALALIILHHLADIEQALAGIHAVLRPGGRLLAVELRPYENERFRVRMSDRRPGIDPARMAEWLKSAGFRDIYRWDFPETSAAEHDLAPLPKLYGMIATR